MAIEKYLDLITSEHRGKPRFSAWLAELLSVEDAADEASGQIADGFLIDSAVGVQLDTLGEYIGVKRRLTFQPSDGSAPIMDDETYRVVLKAWIVRNHWNGENGTMPRIWQDIFSSSQLNVVDNQDMTMTAIATNLGTTPLKQQLIEYGYIVPKPEGVRLHVVYREILPSYGAAVLGAEAMDFGRTETEVGIWRTSNP